MDKFETPAYKKSRVAYIIQCTVEYGVALMLSDAFLAKLLSYIGISDAWIGIISSLISLFLIMQLLSIVLVNCKLGAKKMNLILDTASNIFFMLIYLIPFFNISKFYKVALVIVSIVIAYTFKNSIASIRFQWANSNVDPCKRARYSGLKEIVSLIFGMVFTAVIGYVIDKFEDIGNITGAFLFISISILVLNVLNFICLMLIKNEDKVENIKSEVSVLDSLSYIFKNKDVRNIIFLSIMYEVARYFSIGFMGTFKVKDLAYSVLEIQIINIVSNLIRALFTVPFGKYSDKHSYARGLKLGMSIASLAFFINIFTTVQTRYLIIAYIILLDLSGAGTVQNFYNISFNYSDKKHLVQVMSLRSCISGLFGFVSSLAGGKLLSVIQSKNLTLFGTKIFGQQILSAVSFCILVFCIVFTNKVIEKQKITVQ